MPVDPKVQELVDRWEDLREQGKEVSAQELCREHPELLDELERRIKALKAMAWLADSDSRGDDEKSAAAQGSETPPPTLGRYRLDELIGTGGFGQVWKGFDPQLQRVVAIKIPRQDRLSLQQQEAFIEEARKVAQLKHLGIVPVHDVGRDGEYCFIVSDFIDGGNLADRLAEGRVGWQESVRVIADVAEILECAHQQGFIHRDIKPANILLDEEGKPYLTDFGIAISGEERQQGKTATVGTLAYMSPEQVRGVVNEIDARTDIYSLGIVLYQLLSGHPPFHAQDTFEIRRAILSGEPPLKTIGQGVPVELERICLRATAKNAANRYATARELANDLRKVVSPPHKWLTSWQAVAGIMAMLLVGAIVMATARSPHREPPKPEEVMDALKEYAKSHPPESSYERAMNKPREALREAQSQLSKDYGGLGTIPSAKSAGEGDSAFPRFGTKIDLTGKRVTRSDFERLGRLPLLQHLVLANTTTSDDDLSSLAGIPSLEALNLSGTQITDTGLRSISSIRLRILDLSKTKISNDGLKILCDDYGVGGNVAVLNLSGTGITDAGVQSLGRMKRLRELRVDGTRMTDQGIEKVQTLLPHCKIHREPPL
jgi:serine/threonine protein kinase